MTTAKTPRTPALSVAGRRLWASVTDEYDLLAWEEVLLLAACRTADTLDRLAVEAASGPPTIVNYKGDLTAHPALTESRQQSRAVRNTAMHDPSGVVLLVAPTASEGSRRETESQE
jgi:hypothetical protein